MSEPGHPKKLIDEGVHTLKKSIRTTLLLCIASMMIVLSACGTNSGDGQGSKGSGGSGSGGTGGVIKIGMVADLTGKSALTGEFKKRGAQIALDEINANGGINGKTIELVIEDDRGTNDGTVSSFQKIVSNPDVIAVLGPITSTNAKSISDIAKKTGIPVLIGGTNVGLTTELKNPWFFRIRPHDGYSAQTIADFTADKKGHQKIAIIYDTDAFGTAGKDMLISEYKKKGITPTTVEGITAGTKDFTPTLESIRKSGAEAINTMMTASADVAQLVIQMRQLGINTDLVGSSSAAQTTTVKLAGDKLNGIYGANDFALDQSEEAKQFVDKFQKKYNELPDLYTGWVYDSLHILAKIIKDKGTDPEQMRQGILALKGFKGVEGEYNFDENGDGLHQYSIVKVENGNFVTQK
ncbi:ABC transporter substrate-binding protein [Paenibacillus validus]|uniref:ABC transporter substrate-binding protein n=1 Tax=Paenibacillus validus TaxID=44253 RepID=A0A7X3CSE7_9BACL|nr:ABC transporter substrate-binding protein [Paenibacillus validus]